MSSVEIVVVIVFAIDIDIEIDTMTFEVSWIGRCCRDCCSYCIGVAIVYVTLPFFSLMVDEF